MQLGRVLLPARFAYKAAGVALNGAATMSPLPGSPNVWEVRLPEEKLAFLWPTRPDPNMWFMIEQEIDVRNPHCYTTAPIKLDGQATVLDVGACEGLFAYRALRRGLAKRVIAFEPSPIMATLIEKGMASNGIASGLQVVRAAVGEKSGSLKFDFDTTADAGRIAPDGARGTEVPCVTIDDYCRDSFVTLSQRDLIKIDAEGADFDVLKGAEETIRRYGPQIAVTTYHVDEHAASIAAWLQRIRPDYRMRLKGFSFWTDTPRPVLLQASTLT